MNPDLEVDTDDLSRVAAALTGVAARVAGVAAQSPPALPTPGWATAEALATAVDAARTEVARLGADLAETARQITRTAAAYQGADARAAARLRSVR